MEEKLNKRQQQAAQTKERLQREGMRLFFEKGYDNTKITDICRAAEVSTGIFYHYFPSKDHLYLSAYDCFDDFVEQILSKRTYSSLSEAIRTLIYAQICSVRDFGAERFYAIMNTRGTYAEENGRFVYAYMKQILAQGVKNGTIHPSHDLEYTARLLFQLARGIMFDSVVWGQEVNWKAQVNLALDLILSSLKQPKPSEKNDVDLTDYENWQAEYFKEKGWLE